MGDFNAVVQVIPPYRIAAGSTAKTLVFLQKTSI